MTPAPSGPSNGQLSNDSIPAVSEVPFESLGTNELGVDIRWKRPLSFEDSLDPITLERVERLRWKNQVDVCERLGAHCSYVNDNLNFRYQRAVGEHLDELAKRIPYVGIDRTTLQLAESARVSTLFGKRDSFTAQQIISRNFRQPCTDVEWIRAKQEAYRELQDNPRLAKALSNFCDRFTNEFEVPLISLVTLGVMAGQYGNYQRQQAAVVSAIKEIEKMEQPQSPYLKMLFDQILSLRGTRSYKCFKEGVYITKDGIKPKSELDKTDYKNAVRFKPTIFSPSVLIAGSCVPVTLVALFKTGTALIREFGFAEVSTDLFMFSQTGGFLATMFGGLGAMAGLLSLKSTQEQETVGTPLTAEMRDEDLPENLLNGIGGLVELNMGMRYIQSSNVDLNYPEVKSASHHYLKIDGMRSPLFLNDRSFVANNIKLGVDSVTMATGPTSGGKTTLCRSIVNNQLLAQMALPIPCDSALIVPATTIAYQVPDAGEQEGEHGRFGTEYQRTISIVANSHPHALSIFDELAGGAQHTETDETSKEILEASAGLEGSTFLVTHNLALARDFERHDIGCFYQVEFLNGYPTHNLIKGVASSSHTQTTRKRLGGSRDNLRQLVVKHRSGDT